MKCGYNLLYTSFKVNTFFLLSLVGLVKDDCPKKKNNYQFLRTGFDSSQHFNIVILSRWKIFTSAKRGFLGNAKILHKVVFMIQN